MIQNRRTRKSVFRWSPVECHRGEGYRGEIAPVTAPVLKEWCEVSSPTSLPGTCHRAWALCPHELAPAPRCRVSSTIPPSTRGWSYIDKSALDGRLTPRTVFGAHNNRLSVATGPPPAATAPYPGSDEAGDSEALPPGPRRRADLRRTGPGRVTPVPVYRCDPHQAGSPAGPRRPGRTGGRGRGADRGRGRHRRTRKISDGCDRPDR